MKHSVLIVEDDMMTREYLAEALGGPSGPYQVSTAATVQQAALQLDSETPDVMLVDLGLPDGNGIELIKRAKETESGPLTLVISVFGDERSVIGAIEAGAQGYLLKSEAPEDLRRCVQQILEGGAPISPGIAAHVLRRLRSPASERSSDDHGVRLTDREQQVLELLVKGLTYKQAAGALGLSRDTIASHIKHVYQKLEVESRGEAVYEALSRGIVKV